MKKLPIGISDFKELIEGDYYYVDKTLFIKEVSEVSSKVILVPRPRRFGKTLNLSMIRYFFEKSIVDNSHLFHKTTIWQDQNISNLFGSFPVIYLTFKDIKESNWDNTLKKIKSIISAEFERHFDQVKECLTKNQIKNYLSIIDGTAHEADYSTSLLFLSEILNNFYGKKVLVLVDEYDSPIHSAYNNGFYNQIIDFIRSLLTSVLKDNKTLEKGILSGILRTAKEGIFSGLNNMKVYSITDESFQDKFGFTQLEVQQLLKDQKLQDQFDNFKSWYNGYLFGSTTIYNPWSILMCADERALLKPYWVNTSDNQLVKKLIVLSEDEIKSGFELLLEGKSIKKEIDDAIIFPGIENNGRALWSLLLYSGYLTYNKLEVIEGITYCDLVIPNKEINSLYKNFVQEILVQSLSTQKIKELLNSLSKGDAETFGELLQEFISSSMSVFDLPADEPEKSYHLFVLGLLVMLSDTYEVKSNRESGFGRYDIMLIPRKSNNLGIVIEFKKVSAFRNETLETAAQKALDQIIEKKYGQKLRERGIKRIKLFDIAFQGKNIFIISQDNNFIG